MKCPYCGFSQDRVVDSRESKEADSIRRRRECEGCNKRFTTYERIDEIPYMVVKKDGRREKFDRQKVLSGLLHACEKRPVAAVKLEQIVDETEAYVVDSPERERSTSEVGELIMSRLKEIDTVAYIRFASVYRDFKDVREFKAELEELLSGKDSEAEVGGRRMTAAKRTHKITLIPGDGIGPEVSGAVVNILEAAGAATGVAFEWHRYRCRRGGVCEDRRVHSEGAV